ncbi:hypothetical protein GTW25_16290 [Aliihoeflea aestuarii]|jgi:mannose/cellobiose epimerase-like protein (N-acyl-D-glucosamine 2-epimerase family)|uniref:AGE family epimerase/isomerase n=1 Tax=Aliihoeflea aestuarii TaxID=453840 RepID=UPI0020959A55|nr:AGE family epimerase/isomerase [Aliihoeflea aestuarii]MCO6392586.1 hypothetical protein [Aliihoeflea aestuarii]
MNASTFALDFVPRWLEAVRAPSGGLFERLDLQGRPVAADEPRTSLVHARTAFALAHLSMATGDARLLDGARHAYVFLDGSLRDENGGYRLSTASSLRRSYDQSFALLALVTLRKADPQSVPQERIDACVAFIDGVLTDARDGSLFEDDTMARSGPNADDLRAQNPHMHMLEAYLQAFEMTGEDHWLARASALVALVRRHFIDPATGAVREFVGHDLAPATGEAGARREPGHQYEWAWLLHRFADLGGDESARQDAARMLAFADRFALRNDGPLAGAPFDALDADGHIVEDTHLLWPLTEAGKLHSALYLRTGNDAHRIRAERIETLIFNCFFTTSDHPVFVNRVNGTGKVLWPEALTRLVYHVALFVTEAERAGIRPHAARPSVAAATKPILEEERS